MHLLIDISAHGLGHLAQTAPVIDALQARFPDLQLTVRSALPRSNLERRIAADFTHLPESRDFGFVMHNAVDIDLAASANAYRECHTGWPQKIASEAAWLKANRVDAVLTNAAYLPLTAAADAGLPSACLCSLNWADLFIHYFAGETWAQEIHAEMLAAYRTADCFLRVTPGLPMESFSRVRAVGPIASLGRRDKNRLSQRLGIAADHRLVLLAMGGMEFRLPVETWDRVPGISWLVPDAWQVRRDDVRAFDNTDIGFRDVLASVDAVVTKPGYGTFAEAACGGIPMLYLQRDDWLETRHFSAWLATHARSRELSRSRLIAGDFIDDLNRLWQQQAPAVPLASGIEEAADSLRAVLDLR